MYEFELTEDEAKHAIAMLNVAGPGGMMIDEMQTRLDFIEILSRGGVIKLMPAYFVQLMGFLVAFRFSHINMEGYNLVRRLQQFRPRLEAVENQEGA